MGNQQTMSPNYRSWLISHPNEAREHRLQLFSHMIAARQKGQAKEVEELQHALFDVALVILQTPFAVDNSPSQQLIEDITQFGTAVIELSKTLAQSNTHEASHALLTRSKQILTALAPLYFNIEDVLAVNQVTCQAFDHGCEQLRQSQASSTSTPAQLH